MKKVGEILKTERLRQGLQLRDIEKKIKIREKFLKAIEENCYEKIGGSVYVFGFVRNYSRFLGLNTCEIEAFLRRETSSEKEKILPKDESNSGGVNFKLTPTIFLVFILSLVFSVIAFYLFTQSRNLLMAPGLSVSSPQDKLITKDNSIVVSGKAANGSELFINGQEIEVSTDGNFNQKMELIVGQNRIEIKVKDKFGKEKIEEREVWRVKN